jgi:hypothetical protein
MLEELLVLFGIAFQAFKILPLNLRNNVVDELIHLV